MANSLDSVSNNTPAIGLSWQDSWPAPAKINLFLHVVGRRDDGYHLLQTAFRFLDIADHLRFASRDDGRIVLETPIPGVPAESDLTVRAAKALQSAAKTQQGVSIWLEKHLPMGGGLGGGSSDAATVLIALNSLWQSQLSQAELEAIALPLGADVPVFVHGRSTFAEGVGEQFHDIQPAPAWYLLLVPPVQVPTAEVFRQTDLCRNTPTINAEDWRDGFGHNDLTPVACRLYPEVARHLDWLAQFDTVLMSGSGACCFAAFPSENTAKAALAQLPSNMRGFITKGIDLHPIYCSVPIENC
jgi:4-diphosphocytidyl-2-C-methyl-D-erythritol kinase